MFVLDYLSKFLGSTYKIDIASFQLISKVPNDPFFHKLPLRFIPNLIENSSPPTKGYYFTEQIGCADDIVVIALKEFNSDAGAKLKNQVEYRALGFSQRLQQVMMEAACNPICAKAKWISFTCNALGVKNGNKVIGLLENTHPDVDSTLQVEFEIYNTIDSK
jgi:hypothetical protein